MADAHSDGLRHVIDQMRVALSDAETLLDQYEALVRARQLAGPRAAPPTPRQSYAPFDCPICGAPMVERTHGKTGEVFYGCSRFVSHECKGTRNLQGQVTGGLSRMGTR